MKAVHEDGDDNNDHSITHPNSWIILSSLSSPSFAFNMIWFLSSFHLSFYPCRYFPVTYDSFTVMSSLHTCLFCWYNTALIACPALRNGIREVLLHLHPSLFLLFAQLPLSAWNSLICEKSDSEINKSSKVHLLSPSENPLDRWKPFKNCVYFYEFLKFTFAENVISPTY